MPTLPTCDTCHRPAEMTRFGIRICLLCYMKMLEAPLDKVPKS